MMLSKTYFCKINFEEFLTKNKKCIINCLKLFLETNFKKLKVNLNIFIIN